MSHARRPAGATCQSLRSPLSTLSSSSVPTASVSSSRDVGSYTATRPSVAMSATITRATPSGSCMRAAISASDCTLPPSHIAAMYWCSLPPLPAPVERPRTVVSTSASSAISSFGRVRPRVTAYGLTSAPVGSSRSGIVTAHPFLEPIEVSLFINGLDSSRARRLAARSAEDPGRGTRGGGQRLTDAVDQESHLVAHLTHVTATCGENRERRAVGDGHQEKESIVHLDHRLQHRATLEAPCGALSQA